MSSTDDATSNLYKRPGFLRVGASGRRRALLIGLNYSGLPESWDIPPLAGAINDVFTMIEALKLCYGFQQHDIRLLVDSDPLNKPTREMFLRGLKWLVEGTGPGDTSVLFFAGHGSVFKVPFTKEPDAYACLCLSDGLLLLSEIWNETQFLPRGCCFACFMDTSFAQDSLDLTERTLANVGYHDPAKKATASVRFLPPRKPPAWFDTSRFPPTSEPRGGFAFGANGFVLAASGSNQVALECYDERKNRVGGFFTTALELAMNEFLGRPVVVKVLFRRVQEIMEDICCVEGLEVESQVPVMAFSPECPPETISFLLPLSMYTNHTDFRHQGESVGKPRPPYVRTGYGSYATPGASDKKPAVGATGRPIDEMVKHVRIVSPVGDKELATGMLEATQNHAVEKALRQEKATPRPEPPPSYFDTMKSYFATAGPEAQEEAKPDVEEPPPSYFETMKSYFMIPTATGAAEEPKEEEDEKSPELDLPPGVLLFYEDKALALLANGDVVVREGPSLETPIVTTLKDRDQVSVGTERAMVLNDSNERVERARLTNPVQGWVSTVCLQRPAQTSRPMTTAYQMPTYQAPITSYVAPRPASGYLGSGPLVPPYAPTSQPMMTGYQMPTGSMPMYQAPTSQPMMTGYPMPTGSMPMYQTGFAGNAPGQSLGPSGPGGTLPGGSYRPVAQV